MAWGTVMRTWSEVAGGAPAILQRSSYRNRHLSEGARSIPRPPAAAQGRRQAVTQVLPSAGAALAPSVLALLSSLLPDRKGTRPRSPVYVNRIRLLKLPVHA
jgi:hypothetical protein